MKQQLAEELGRRLHEAPVVPLVVAGHVDAAIETTRALVAGGLSVVEIVLRTSPALGILAEVVKAVPDALVGAGTVLSGQQGEAAVEAGAGFLVSPGLDASVVEVAAIAGIPVFPGIATATEAQRAWNMGLRAVKFFPASLAGGPAMIRALGAVFRELQFMPTGGVSAANLPEYLSLPGVIACGGSWLTPGAAIAEGNYQRVTELAAEALAIAKGIRG